MTSTFTIGDIIREKFIIDTTTVRSFSEFSGDTNPLHMDRETAKSHGYSRPVAHGVILLAYLSKIIGNKMPGTGSLWMNQSVEWLAPVLVGDEVELTITLTRNSAGTGICHLDSTAVNQDGKIVMRGISQVKLAPHLVINSIGEQKNSVQTSTRLKVETPRRLLSTNSTETQRVALITGGSRGIGAAMAKELARSGVTVIINYNKDSVSAKAVVEEIRKSGGHAQSLAADVGNPQDTYRMIENIYEKFNRCDIVVHGATPPITQVKATDLNYSILENYLKVYVGGAIAIAEKTVSSMSERKFGRFIFLGTSFLWGSTPSGMAAYVTAKEALWGFVKALATEVGPQGITCNMVSPGVTVTDLTSDVPARIKEVEARKSPMRRLATPEDTAAFVGFLASDFSGYINGQNIPLIGGPL